MKMICPFLGLVLFLSACEDVIVDSLPEPELEVVSIVFSEARYTADTNTVFLSFNTRYDDYDGMFETYNKQKVFLIENYIGNHNFSIRNTRYTGEGLEIDLEGTQVPEKIFFNTEKPCYFFTRYEYYSYIRLEYAVITAKAFIRTPELAVKNSAP